MISESAKNVARKISNMIRRGEGIHFAEEAIVTALQAQMDEVAAVREELRKYSPYFEFPDTMYQNLKKECEALKARESALLEGLEFYSIEANYEVQHMGPHEVGSPIERDRGKCAKRALAPAPPSPKIMRVESDAIPRICKPHGYRDCYCDVDPPEGEK